MANINPDTTVFELIRSQPEFNEQLWQYLNRRVSDWRITTGKEKAKEYAPLFARIENLRAAYESQRPQQIERALENLRMALQMKMGSASTEQIHSITDILDAATKQIERI